MSTNAPFGEEESAWHDLVRCFLLAQVVLGHLGGIALPSIPELLMDGSSNLVEISYRTVTRFGAQAAYAFIFLSGFTVGGQLASDACKGVIAPPIEFLRRRVRRVVPIAFLAIVATAILDYVGIFALEKAALYRTVGSYDILAAYSIENFVGNILFLQPVFVDSFGSNGPLWTLGYIVQYYILGWMIFFAISNNRALGFFLTLALLALMTFVHIEWAVLFIVWLCGALARLIPRDVIVGSPVVVCGALVFVLSNLLEPLGSAALAIPAGVAFVLWARSTHLSMPKVLSANLRGASNRTYTIYASHYPVSVLLFVVLLGVKTDDLAIFGSYVALCLLGTLLMTLVIEYLSSRRSPALFRSAK